MPSTPVNDDGIETRPRAPVKTSELGTASLEYCAESPIAMKDLDECRDFVPSNDTGLSTPEPETDGEAPRESDQGTDDAQDEEERQRREEEESIALARALMAEEAMAVSYHMSVDYLRTNRDQFSEEDLAALQAVMEEDEQQEEVEEAEDDGGMSYELMLRLGERMGDVKSERWSRVAREKINQLPTFKFDPESVKDKDENDCEVKCLVCQFAYEKEECLRRLPCKHCFHSECVDQWLMTKDFCLYCRKPIIEEK